MSDSEYYEEESFDDHDDICDEIFRMEEQDRKQRTKNYKIMSFAEIHGEMDKIASEVSSLIALPKIAARTLLHYFKWNKESLVEKFYDAPDLSRFGIVDAKSKPAKMDKAEEQYCLICDGEKNLESMDCGHEFCRDCWQQYLKTKVVSDGVSRILCPATKCSAFVPDVAIVRLITEPTIKQLFLKLMTNDFVKGNKNMQFCPATDCGLVCRADSTGCQLVVCTCSHAYCFTCSEPWHSPVGCELLTEWLKQCRSDAETFNWIAAYTKDCPKCKSAIEKNGGCNRIVCRSCDFEFCWSCMQIWSVHGYSNCNRYEAAMKEHEEKTASPRAALDRYLHYYNRYRNHENSLKLEKKLYKKLEEASLMFQERQGIPFSETRFLLQPVNVLGECRRMLMYTYAFAFYLEKNNAAVIFEDNQQDLELATEALSDLLENKLSEDMDFIKMRQEVIDKAKYLEMRKDILVEHCREGTEHDEWKFNIKINIGTIPPY